MLSIKRLLGVLLITLFISALFLIYSINSNRIDVVSLKNNIPGASSPLEFGTVQAMPYRFVLIGENGEIKNNVSNILEEIGASLISFEKLDQPFEKNDIAVFCQPNLSKCIDLRMLETFIGGGGQAIFAAGLSEGHNDSYLYSVMGIIEKSVRLQSQQYHVEPGFLPFGDGEVICPDYNASTFINVVSDAEIYLSDITKNYPLIYSRIYKDGKLAVINGTLLEVRENAGLFLATVSSLMEDFIYPVLGTSSVFLDNFPITTQVNDKESMRLYGRNTATFVIDRVWPIFQSIAVRNHLKYTSGILTVSSGLDQFPPVDTNLFYTIGKAAMQLEGEVAFAGSFSQKGDLLFNDVFEKDFQEVFENYKINAFVLQDGYPSEAQLNEVYQHYSDVGILRGYVSAEQKENFFGVNGQNFVTLPVYSQGLNYKDGSQWRIMMSVAEKGLLSHKFDINTMMGLTPDMPTWEENCKSLEQYETQVFRKLSWLDSRTLSEQLPTIQSYVNTSYGWEADGEKLVLGGKSIYDGQAFLLRSEKDIEQAIGCEYQRINGCYSIIRINSSDVRITFK